MKENLVEDSLLTESSQVALGEVDEDEKVCGKRYCCKKRKCCTKVVYFVVLLDWIWFMELVAALSYFYLKSITSDTEKEREAYRIFATRGTLVNLGFTLSLLMKAITGYKWLKDQTRKNFVKYYLWGVTKSGTSVFQSLEFLAYATYYLSTGLEYFLLYFGQGMIEIILLEVHMRYLDSIHIARNDLKKDIAIINSYKML